MFRNRRFIFSRGFTLVEVIIAVGILAVMTTAIISGMVLSSKMVRLNTNAIVAKNIAQGMFEQMNAGSFSGLNTPNINVTTTTYLDHSNNIQCTVTTRFTGFGTATGGGSNSLADSSATWQPDEWAGHTVYLVSGTGSGSSGVITTNAANSLTISGTFSTQPASGTKYMIDNGKTVHVTTQWNYQGKAYSEAVSSLIVNWRGESLPNGW